MLKASTSDKTKDSINSVIQIDPLSCYLFFNYIAYDSSKQILFEQENGQHSTSQATSSQRNIAIEQFETPFQIFLSFDPISAEVTTTSNSYFKFIFISL